MKNEWKWLLISFSFLIVAVLFQYYGKYQFKTQNHPQILEYYFKKQLTDLEKQLLEIDKDLVSFSSKKLLLDDRQSFCLIANGKAIFWQGEMHGIPIEWTEKSTFIVPEEHAIKIGFVLRSDTTKVLFKTIKNPIKRFYYLGFGKNKIQIDGQTYSFSIGNYYPKSWLIFSALFYLFFFLSFLLSFFGFVRQKKFKVQLVLISILFILRIFHAEEIIAFRTNVLFNPQYFAISKWVPSLGDLIYHVVLGLIVAGTLTAYLKRFEESKLKFIPGLLLIVGLFFFTDMVLGLSVELVENSSLVFDVNQINKINFFTLIALMLIAICFLSIPFFAYHIFQSITHKGFLMLLGSVVFLSFQWIDSGKNMFELLIACLYLWALYISHISIGKIKYKWLSFIGMTLLLMTFKISQSNQKKEDNYVQLFVHQTLFAKDIKTEYAFEKVENDLIKIFLEPFDYKNGNTSERNATIRNLFFYDQLNKYEIFLQNFDKNKQAIEANTYPIEILDDLYNNKNTPTLSRYFFRILDPQWLNSYIAKFENCDQNGDFGNLYILLRPKRIQQGANMITFPKKTTKPLHSSFSRQDYHFGIYKNEKLIYQSGNFAFPDFQKPVEFVEKIKRNKLWQFGFRNGLSVQVVKTNQAWNSAFSLLLVLSGIIAASILIFILFEWLFLQNSIRSLFSLKNSIITRTQMLSISLLIVGMIAAMYVMTRYVALNHSSRIKLEIGQKLKDVGNLIALIPAVEQKVESTNQALSIINKLSSEQKTNIRLFNLDGELVSSSGKVLPKLNRIPHMMPSSVFRKLTVDQHSQYLQEEWVNGKKVYSAYAPIYNPFGRKIMYLNLPYFEETNIVRKELGKLFVSFLNVYFLLILIGAVSIYFLTKRVLRPLVLIQQKMAQTSLNGKNEVIQWKRNDEIGELIQQYNQMVLKLEKNLEVLAKSERESAWREMAKQVAHEIKNPLTPMKLNLQFLQKAIKENEPNLIDKFRKTADSIIFQIDNLSEMASEFSNFAQLAEPKNQQVDLNQLITKQITLFQNIERTQLIFDTDCEKAMSFCDEKNMSRVFTNLITNAIQAIPEKRSGKVKIKLIEEELDYSITISDNGSGISNRKASQIFQPKFSTKTSGMGLGLAITKNIVEQAKGHISFQSVIGEGTSFTIKLPKS